MTVPWPDPLTKACNMYLATSDALLDVLSQDEITIAQLRLSLDEVQVAAESFMNEIGKIPLASRTP